MPEHLQIVILGPSLTSSRGNSHATTYRGLARELKKRGHEVWFLERDVPRFAEHRDLPEPDFCSTHLYKDRAELEEKYRDLVSKADAVIVGSFVPDGCDVGMWVTRTAEGVSAFYDIDTPVTLAKLKHGDFEYISPMLIPRYNLYLSFTGGPTLDLLEIQHGSPRARALYCSFDPELYFPEPGEDRYDLAYMGTFSEDRQPKLERLLMQPALLWKNGRFAVVGPQYPQSLMWPANVDRIEHLPPSEHRSFYNSQRFALNITRFDMIEAGYSPSVRLFEAAACGTPIISDYWQGLESFFKINQEILVAETPQQALRYLKNLSEDERLQIGENARKRASAEHTVAHRAEALEGYLLEAMETKASAKAAYPVDTVGQA